MNVLITGEGSYVGNNLNQWLTKFTHKVEEIEVRSDKYKILDYSKYHTIIHVAAIVHKKEKIPWETYHQVNTELPLEIARLAKDNGVSQFIFFSTMGVYGKGKALPHGNVIDGKEKLNPQSDYSKSKLLAEEGLQNLEDDHFKVVIVRPPSIYGENCPGNYIQTFNQLARKIPVFPYAFNQSKQSFLYIDNLCEFISLCMEQGSSGVFHPQDYPAVSTVELIDLLAKLNGKKMKFSKILGKLAEILPNLSPLNKLYGGVSYTSELSNHFDNSYQLYDVNEGFAQFIGKNSQNRVIKDE